MFNKILDVARSSEYDFRQTANPNDPLKHLFADWVDYYRLKWSIAHVLQPKSILEVGVRFGYSALAFLNACPQSSYLGIDLDSDSFGGVKGAIRWAEEITRPFKSEFIIGDTQQMSRFPGQIYDLIHVDGQQDGDGSWHDLQMALQQARWILADGFFWTEQNFAAISQFLYRYRDLIQFYGVIPGYAGELLIKTSPEYLKSDTPVEGRTTSRGIRESFTSSYYLQECGGFEEYKQSGGKFLNDARLQALATVAAMRNPQRVLDLGCGRGELTHFFADQGAQVMAVDYSNAAIELCEKTFEGEPTLRNQVHLVCANICEVRLSGVFDAITASDVIQHLSPAELEVLYRRVSQHLAQTGLFVLHTSPNLWYYKYHYARRRRLAELIGAYLPPQPRTRSELLMHINEQSPRVLKQSLQRYFNNVLVWFGEPGRPIRSMLEKMSHWELAASRDLFAVASHSFIDMEELKQGFLCWPLPLAELDRIQLRVSNVPTVVAPASEFSVLVHMSNESPSAISSCPPNPIHISYHWLQEDAHGILVFDGERSGIKPPLYSGARRHLNVRVRAPMQTGTFVLRLTLVQELVRWFDNPPLSVKSDVHIRVGN